MLMVRRKFGLAMVVSPQGLLLDRVISASPCQATVTTKSLPPPVMQPCPPIMAPTWLPLKISPAPAKAWLHSQRSWPALLDVLEQSA